MRKTLKRAAPYIKTGIRAARFVRQLQSSSKRRRIAGDSNPSLNLVTTQRDYKTSKKTKYNPKKEAKRKAFANKIQKALEPRRELNVYSEIYTGQVVPSYATADANVRGQLVTEISLQMNMGKLWSLLTNTGFIMGRYQNMVGSTDVVSNRAAKSIIPNNQFQLKFTNSTMDLSISNPNTNTQQTVYDVYEFVAAKNISEANYSSPAQAWAQCLLDNYAPTDASTRRPTINDNGQTPYDCPQLGKYWKILKKTRILITQGNTTEYKLSCGKFTMEGDLFQNQYAIAGISKSVIIIAGVGDNTLWPLSTNVLRYVPQKTWHFKYNVGESELPQRPTNLLRSI